MSVIDEDVEQEAATKRPNAFVRLYRGDTSFDFVGRRRWWYALSAVIIVAGLASFAVRGFNWGIEFKGGTSWEVPANGHTVSDVQTAVTRAGLTGATVQVLGRGADAHVQVQADLNKQASSQQTRIKQAVTEALASIGHVPAPLVSVTDIGPTWGSQISQKAVIAVLVFFVVVVVYISFRFEWKMAMAALIAVIHDLAVTAGVYSLAGFQVTPDTVIALLTILGYSLYDTVVVFDRVKENSKGLTASGRMTYEDIVNLSMNQTLARSINTSLVAILPVLAVLVIGAQLLGATTLQYFGLALVIGLTSGAYSSIFIASPVLASLKEREPRYISIRNKLANRSDRAGLLTPRQAATLALAGGAGGTRGGGSQGTNARRRAQAAQGAPGVLRPGSATRRPPAADAGADLDDAPGTDEDVATPARAGAGSRSNGSGRGARPAASGQARPAPRPRKGKGGKKGGRRR
ncbi:MAG TPA: protein translocase subunit SecF [Acidimicrobiales bacterium]|nr:protein translocase subunit SecF [Acidimicrobiales bacterium]